jgi:very-short-patch-repair endonuclease
VGPTPLAGHARGGGVGGRHGLPSPRINVTVNGKEVDALFPEERVIVELDRVEFHNDPISFRNDRRRDRGSAAHGYVKVRLLKEV